MAWEHREGRASLFRNKQKKSEKQPDYRGDGMYNGEIVELAGWKNTTKNGEAFLNISIQPKQEREQQSSSSASVDPDDIPF